VADEDHGDAHASAERRDRAQAVVALLGTLLALSLVALMVVTLAWRSSSGGAAGEQALALQQAGTQAQAAARRAVIEMTTYDYRTVDKDFAWVDDAGTAAFRQHYAQVSSPIKQLVVRMQAKAQGSVVASATEVKDADHVVVLLFVDQVITNPGQSGKGLDQPRVTMSMVRQGGRWLVQDVSLNTLAGPAG
jgi:Mce-associated membrane protein